MLAQAGSGAAVAAADRPLAGYIEQIIGQVFVLKLDGSRVAARIGAQVFEGDILVTQPGAGATIAFDRAVAALGSDARMLIETGGAQPVFFVLQGQFGMQVVRGVPNTPDQVTIRTPVSSVVLRRGRMLGRAAAEAVSNSFVLLPNSEGGAGVLSVTTAAGAVLLDRALQGTSVVSLFRSPMPAFDRDLVSLQGEFGGFLAGWLPSSRPVAAASLLPDSLFAMLGAAGDALAERGARLIDLIFPSAAAALASEFAPAPEQRQIFMPAPPPAATPGEVLPPPPGPQPAPDAPQRFDAVLGPTPTPVPIIILGGSGFDLLAVSADPVQPNNISIGADDQGRVVLTNGGSTIVVDNVEDLSLTLGAGNDVIELGDLSATDIADSTVIINAGDGDDSVDGSLAGKRLVLFGEAGNDTLTGGSKDDDLFGGPGDDLLTGGDGNDLIDGGEGSDTANFAGASGSVSVDLAAGTATGQGNDTLAGIEHVIGSPFADVLTGNELANRIDGRAGDDTLAGGDGDDTLIGGDGQDTASFAGVGAAVQVSLLVGTATGNGNDMLSGVEHVIGSPFADVVTGNGLANRLEGRAGDDTLAGGDGDDTLIGGDGQDTASFAGAGAAVQVSLLAGTATGNGNDILSDIEHLIGSGFGDTLTGSADANAIDGQDGDDLLIWQAGAGNDTVMGGNGVDRLDATVAGSVSLTSNGSTATLAGNGSVSITGVEVINLVGSAGDDAFTFGDLFGTGVTTVSANAGAGIDSASFSAATAGVTVDIASSTATGFAQFLGFEAVTGSAFADTLSGDNAGNMFDGGLGSDSIDARGGNDLIAWASGAGNDTVDGGSGSDTLVAAIFGAVSLTRSGSTAVLSGNGSADLDGIELVRLTGGASNDSFTLGNLAGTLDAVEINGGAGTDTAIFTDVPGGVTVDLTAGTVGVNGNLAVTVQSIESVIGSDQRDTLLGSASADVLAGGAAADTIDGRDGDDRIVYAVGDGDDTVEGGIGSDVLEVSFGTATVELSANQGALRVEVAMQGPDDRLEVRTVETVSLVAGGGNDTITIGGNGSTIELGNLAGTGVATIEVRGGTGNDMIDASGTSQALRLFGDDGDDTLIGNGGLDTLIGGVGVDLLQGSAGDAEAFRYLAPSEAGDTITAFESGTDMLQLSSGGFGVSSIVDGQNFFQAALGGPLGVSNAAFIFDSGTGNFAYDSDGDGAAAVVVLATLQTGTVQVTDLQVF